MGSVYSLCKEVLDILMYTGLPYRANGLFPNMLTKQSLPKTGVMSI